MTKHARRVFIKFFAVVFSGVLVVWLCAEAHATFVSPKRVTIPDGARAGQITIHNGTDQTMIYRFSWEDRAQKPGGEIMLLGEGETVPGYHSAKDMLKFSPRQVVLKPKSHQKIRILVQRPADLPEGEYHSHFLIKAEPAGNGALDENKEQSGLKGLFHVRANVSLPVFLRQGATQINTSVDDAVLLNKGGRDLLKLKISNDSTRSFYARSELDCVSSDGKVESRTLPTVRIYTEVKSIDREMNVPKDFLLSGCTALKYKLMGTDDFEYKNKVISEINVRRN